MGGSRTPRTMPYFPQGTSYSRGVIAPTGGLSNPSMGETWSDLFMGIDPTFLSFYGTGFALGLSVLGAAWGIFLTGSSLLGAANQSATHSIQESYQCDLLRGPRHLWCYHCHYLCDKGRVQVHLRGMG